jgi:hypothetical protein
MSTATLISVEEYLREGHFEALDGVLRTSDGRLILAIADLFTLDS